jgi:hypothetical protein
MKVMSENTLLVSDEMLRLIGHVNGNCRTQAAKAMNEHATAAHGRPIPMSPRDAQMWHAH